MPFCFVIGGLPPFLFVLLEQNQLVDTAPELSLPTPAALGALATLGFATGRAKRHSHLFGCTLARGISARADVALRRLHVDVAEKVPHELNVFALLMKVCGGAAPQVVRGEVSTARFLTTALQSFVDGCGTQPPLCVNATVPVYGTQQWAGLVPSQTKPEVDAPARPPIQEVNRAIPFAFAVNSQLMRAGRPVREVQTNTLAAPQAATVKDGQKSRIARAGSGRARAVTDAKESTDLRDGECASGPDQVIASHSFDIPDFFQFLNRHLVETPGAARHLFESRKRRVDNARSILLEQEPVAHVLDGRSTQRSPVVVHDGCLILAHEDARGPLQVDPLTALAAFGQVVEVGVAGGERMVRGKSRGARMDEVQHAHLGIFFEGDVACFNAHPFAPNFCSLKPWISAPSDE